MAPKKTDDDAFDREPIGMDDVPEDDELVEDDYDFDEDEDEDDDDLEEFDYDEDEDDDEDDGDDF